MLSTPPYLEPPAIPFLNPYSFPHPQVLLGSALKHWSRVKRHVAQDGCDRVSSGKVDPRPALEGRLHALSSSLYSRHFPIKWCNRTFILFFEKGWVILFSGLCAIDPLQSVSGKNETFFSYGINKKRITPLLLSLLKKIENI